MASVRPPLALIRSRHSSPIAWLSLALGSIILIGLAVGTWALLGSGGCGASSRPTEIFQGVVYGCEELAPSAEGHGAIHWVKIDLNAPGIGIFVTPLDPSAVEQGFQYRLRWVSSVLRAEKLAVATNGALFTSVPTWRPRLPGDLARGVDTVVSDHAVSHVWEHSYLLWFDDELTPTLEMTKPPSAKALASAKWGIAGQGVGLHNGELSTYNTRIPNARTAIAIDRERKLLFLAVGEFVSPHLILATLARLGARDGLLLDGGGSSTMAVRGNLFGSKVLFGGWRAVATQFGVRARPVAVK